MGKVSSIQEVVSRGLCVSCGACVSAAPAGSMRLVLDEKLGIFVPEIIDTERARGDGVEFDVCPGKGLAIKKMASELYGPCSYASFELGRYRFAIAAHTTNQRILENASSGGVMTDISVFLIEKNLVDGVTASRFVYGAPGPRTEAFIAHSLEELISAQGSKYCPTTTNQLVRKCLETGGHYLFIGTPCQIGALRLGIQQEPRLADIFPYTMANFCGGYRDFRALDRIVSSLGVEPSELDSFRFRGGGQPGSMLGRTRKGMTICEPYPAYGRRSVIPRQKRCWYCVDGTGELADFACGDAWVPRFLEDESPWSIILARSRFAEQLVNEMASIGRLKVQPISFEEICKSQKTNIGSKKFRQYSRMRVSRLLGITMPQWDVELPRDNGSYLYELCVLAGKTAVGQQLRRIMHFCKDSLKQSE